MIRRLGLPGLSAALLTACASTGHGEGPHEAPIEVMVIGSWHMQSTDSNVIDVDGPDVLTAERQAELEALIDRLERFAPTVVAVEESTDEPGFIDDGYSRFSPDMLLANPTEELQIGYRLARRMGHDEVYGIDEQPGAGEPDYFPFGKLMAHMAETGEAEALQATLAEMETRIEATMASFEEMTIGEALAETNRGLLSSADLYYDMLRYDQGESQPAAELYAYYMMRNAKIFSKLLDVTEPGDRVVVVYGAGHKHFLELLAENMPGVERVDPMPYLEGR
ncbi:DUF5694 domain-containing protein [Parvularcula lutaonensis]|uniref:DUF5694 domain-containing protein n=1 Tax=Parvularcula lutaonensis TaxID=491923 RepID=A0ABV7M7L0_9PROT|nr:DUF5694 domain-containing protein [Parvularcula lutaonensis]GGY42504.1 hypothetical protein GCM10007148_08950 [Parvularcula lutaonensis]